MGGVNWPRVILGGLVSGVIINILEGASSLLYGEQMQRAMTEHNFSLDMAPATMVLFLLLGFIAGLGGAWLYAAIRPRYGAGAGTAVKAGVAVWFVGYFSACLGWLALGLYPPGLFAMAALVGLVEIVLGTVVAGWLYRE